MHCAGALWCLQKSCQHPDPEDAPSPSPGRPTAAASAPLSGTEVLRKRRRAAPQFFLEEITTVTDVNYRHARAQVMWKRYARLLAAEQAANKAAALVYADR